MKLIKLFIHINQYHTIKNLVIGVAASTHHIHKLLYIKTMAQIELLCSIIYSMQAESLQRNYKNVPTATIKGTINIGKCGFLLQ